MTLRSWFKRRRQRKDEAAVERARMLADESPRERAETAGGIEGLQADELSARLAHEPSIEDVDRLSDD